MRVVVLQQLRRFFLLAVVTSVGAVLKLGEKTKEEDNDCLANDIEQGCSTNFKVSHSR